MSWRARIGECRCGSHDFKFAQNIVKFLCPCLAVKLILRKEHRHCHKKLLRQLDRATFFVFDQVTVIKRTNTQIGKLQIAFWLEIGIEVIDDHISLSALKQCAPLFRHAPYIHVYGYIL